MLTWLKKHPAAILALCYAGMLLLHENLAGPAFVSGALWQFFVFFICFRLLGMVPGAKNLLLLCGFAVINATLTQLERALQYLPEMGESLFMMLGASFLLFGLLLLCLVLLGRRLLGIRIQITQHKKALSAFVGIPLLRGILLYGRNVLYQQQFNQSTQILGTPRQEAFRSIMQELLLLHWEELFLCIFLLLFFLLAKKYIACKPETTEELPQKGSILVWINTKRDAIKKPTTTFALFLAFMVMVSAALWRMPAFIKHEAWQFVLLFVCFWLLGMQLKARNVMILAGFTLLGTLWRWLFYKVHYALLMVDIEVGSFALPLLGSLLLVGGLLLLYRLLMKNQVSFRKHTPILLGVLGIALLRGIYNHVLALSVGNMFSGNSFSALSLIDLVSGSGSQLYENIFISVLLWLFFLLVQKNSVQRTTHEETPCS